jgi:hypothetical protein
MLFSRLKTGDVNRLMNIDDILKEFGLSEFRGLFVDLYSAALNLATLDEEKRKILDNTGGDDTIWDRLGDVLSRENEDKPISEIIGETYDEVTDFFDEARICWLICETYLQTHPLAFIMDLQVMNAINMFMNLGAGGSLIIK